MIKFNYRTLFYIVFSLFLLALPFSKGISSVAYVSLLVLSIGGLFFKKNHFSSALEHWHILFPSAILFLTLTISLFYSINIKEGARILLSQSKMIGVSLIVALNIHEIRKRYDGYIFIFIRGVVIASCITLFFVCLPESLMQRITEATNFLQPYITHEKKYAFGVYSPFIDRLQFSYLIVVALFLEWWCIYLFTPNKKFPYLPLTFHSGILFILLMVLGARGAQMGFLLGLAVWIIGIYWHYGHPNIAKNYGKAVSTILLVGGLFFTIAILPLLAYKTIPAVQVRYDQLQWEISTYQNGTIQHYDYVYFTSIRRLLSWQHSWELIRENPILGTGIGDYQTAMERAYALDELDFPVNTHSQFLYYYVSAGLLCLLAFLGIWIYWLRTILQQKRYWKSVLSTAIFVFYLVILLLDAPLNFQVGALTFWVVFNLLLIASYDDFLSA